MSCLSSPPGDHRPITRPKLTLQTTSLPRTFGSSTTGLSLSFAAGPTASPTVRNTFKNAYDVASPASATSSPSSMAPPNLRFNNNKPISPYIHHTNNNPNAFMCRSPYQLPLGVRSILRNSPLESASRRRSGSISAGTSGPSGAGARRVFFPAKKQVSYRNPLEEEIRTVRYTAQHLDLFQEEETPEAVHGEADLASEESTPESAEEDDSDSASLLSLSETSSASSDDVSPDDGGVNTSLTKTERKKRRTMRAERQVRAVALLDGFNTDPYASSTPQTPRQGRAKRRREWKWTLGHVSTISDDIHPEVPVQILAPQPVDPPPEKPPGK